MLDDPVRDSFWLASKAFHVGDRSLVVEMADLLMFPLELSASGVYCHPVSIPAAGLFLIELLQD
jgi:hypothetical protein